MLLEKSQIDRIDDIFSKAAASGRRVLYEHEVYAMLEAVGVAVPRWLFLRDARELSAEALAPFGRQAIVKIVSADIAHKSKLGGVKAVRCDEALYVRFVLEAMAQEVLSRFPESQKPRLDGFLVAEFVPFTLALGNEILIGVKEDPSFGPILTLSKGGDDAEFFSRYYDPANLMPVPVSRERAAELTRAIKIRHRYEEAGHPEYCGLIAEALHKVSLLAYQYSFLAKRRPPFYLTALDLNPLVFSKDGRFTAVDGFASFASGDEHGVRPSRPDVSGLKNFFEPEGIAVAGVSSDPGKYSMARIIVQLLSDLGRDDVYCVNPKGGEAEIQGKRFRLYRALDELPHKPSLVVFAAPAGRLFEFLDSVPDGTAVILISGMPQELRFEDFARMLGKHRERRIRFIGPNCMGVYFSPGGGRRGVDTLFIGEDRLKVASGERSNCALFTQSGAMAITSVERTQNAPIFRAIVSFGNKADVNVPDLIRYFGAVPRVEVMAMYIEGLAPGEGREFLDEAAKSEKPIIVFKAGRTAEGARAAASHTAAMSGDYDVFKAACDQAGAILMDELPDFYNAMKAFSMLADKPPLGNRVAGVVNAGLDATMGADLLGYLRQAEFSQTTLERLKRINTHGLANVGAALLDVTPMTDDAMFGDFVEAILDDPGVDCALVAIVPHVENLKAPDGLCRDDDSVASRLIRAARERSKPVVVSINAGNHFLGLVRYLEEGGLPVFPDIRSAVRALDAFARYHVERAKNKNPDA
jgi:3-hydroxypropionyl-CoA synthetase (ADP-forming)